MRVFLWVMVVLALIEFAGAIWNGLKGTVPTRTASGMIINTVCMIGLGGWAFWLLNA